ncbi:MAG: glyoxalase superfamily protein, partial [Kordiimonas sp.]
MERRNMSTGNKYGSVNTDAEDFIKLAKNRAKRLRAYLDGSGHSISHSESLEAIAHSEGYRDWNTYSALFKTVAGEISKPDQRKQQYPFHVGDTVTGTFRGVRFQGTLLGLEETITLGVWRVKMHFDNPVKLPSHEALNLTRQRINCMLNIAGASVNLKGAPDGHIILD